MINIYIYITDFQNLADTFLVVFVVIYHIILTNWTTTKEMNNFSYLNGFFIIDCIKEKLQSEFIYKLSETIMKEK